MEPGGPQSSLWPPWDPCLPSFLLSLDVYSAAADCAGDAGAAYNKTTMPTWISCVLCCTYSFSAVLDCCCKCSVDIQLSCECTCIIVVCNFCFSVGTVFAFISNEKLNDSIQNFNNTVNTAIDHSLDFVLDTQTVRCSL